MRDALGAFYDDDLFAPLYPERGQPAEASWRLALVSVMPFAEGLSDPQAAESVRSRIDWKYALSLDLDAPGFGFSVLSEFRSRLVEGRAERMLLDTMLARFQETGLLKARGKQRTDSTHVLSTARKLNRLETLAETLRAALNAVASVAPKWLSQPPDSEWIDRYGRRVEEYRLPKGEDARKAYTAVVGRDGMAPLDAVYAPGALDSLRDLPAVDVLRRVWLHQSVVEQGALRPRTAKELPPAGLRIESPYDAEARYGHKRSTTWSGHKAHLTETCDDDAPHVVVHVVTTGATEPDIDAAWPVHEALSERGSLPGEHYLDAGYVDADLLVRAPTEYGVEVVGPVRTLNAGPNPKYFGCGRGVTYYNFTSDQMTGFHAVVVPGTLRDSLYMLSGLLEHQTSLQPTEAVTDTAAYSDVVFGLFRLLGYQFSPRLADLGDARLWRMDRQADYGPLDGVARHRVRTDLIRENWDDPLRVAGSLKTGAVGAHEMMRVLQRGGRPSTLAKAVGEVGRVAKTLFLLVCVDDEAYRRRVLTQLNRQESRHGLARVVFHGRRGEIRKQSREGQEAQLARWASSRTRSCCGTRATSRQRWARSERRGTMSETRTWPGSRRWARSTSGCSGATTSSCPVPSRGVSCGR